MGEGLTSQHPRHNHQSRLIGVCCASHLDAQVDARKHIDTDVGNATVQVTEVKRTVRTKLADVEAWDKSRVFCGNASQVGAKQRADASG